MKWDDVVPDYSFEVVAFGARSKCCAHTYANKKRRVIIVLQFNVYEKCTRGFALLFKCEASTFDYHELSYVGIGTIEASATCAILTPSETGIRNPVNDKIQTMVLRKTRTKINPLLSA